ncbi:MAG: DUF4349 domain-containing protein [Phycisphaerales bacterium]
MTLEHEHNDAELEQQLAALSSWDTPAPAVWKRVVPQGTSGGGWRSLIQRPLPGTIMGALAAVLVLALAIGLILPSLSKARSSARVTWAVTDGDLDGRKSASSAARGENEKSFDYIMNGRISAGGGDPGEARLPTHSVDTNWKLDGLSLQGRAIYGGSTPTDPANANRTTSPDPSRQVIRKAMIEMIAKDVRTTFAKVPLILSEAQGEFVQESSMVADAREPDRVTATIVIRVAASRLSKVLGELRELGKVTTESAGGEDVTDQMVDLDARLRNEQRIEKELLALMDTRKDAPLKEIMELRASLDSVRQGIERMAAQRERIGRLVSLATVMVVIRTDKPDPPAPEPKPEPTIGSKFTDAAKSGWANLVGTLTWIVEVAIGGLVWWLIVGLCMTLAWRAARRAMRRGAEESAPSA